MIKIAMIGVGYWGPNLLRIFNSLNGVDVKYVCDANKVRLRRFKKEYGHIEFTDSFSKILEDREVTAIAICTPAKTHYKLARRALMSGKDVFVEKPVTVNMKEAEAISKLSSNRKKIFMVGHLLEYHPAIVKLKDMIQSGGLGKIYYIDSKRLNLGKLRRQENVVWSLAVHDIAAVLYLLNSMPKDVEATGGKYMQNKVEDLSFITLHFPKNILVHIHVSWLHPKKIREIAIVGSKKMAIFDDVEHKNKLKIVNQYIEKQRFVSYNKLTNLKFGRVSFPGISSKEPLRIECEYFIECVKNRRQPKTGAGDGLRVLKVLRAVQNSLKNGKKVRVK